MCDLQHDTNKIKVTLGPVTDDDVLNLVEMHTAAFKSDQFSNLMILNPDEKAHQRLMQKSIQSWISDPAAQLIQATDTSEEVLGWACLVLKGVDSDKPDASDLSTPSTESKHRLSSDTIRSKVGREAELVHQLPKKEPARVLGGLMRKDLVQWEDKHMKGKKYRVLQALATSPNYQNRGIGLNWFSGPLIKSMPRAFPTGYMPRLRVTVCTKGLDYKRSARVIMILMSGAPGGKGGSRGWGRYTFWYMLRLPRNHV